MSSSASDLPPRAALAERVRQANPFSINRVDLRSSGLVDVADVHRGPYDRLVALAAQACAEDRGIGAVLWGEAGTGKSHLLDRLARWAGPGDHACFAYLHNLLPDAEAMPRYVLTSVLAALTRGQPGRSPLFRTVNGAVMAALKHEKKPTADWQGAEAAFFRHVHRLAAVGPGRAILLDADIYRALFVYYRAINPSRPEGAAPLAPLALRWLSGEAIDPAEAQRLGLTATRASADDGVRLADDQRIKQVFVALAQLSRCRMRPLLLCFDQVENLDPARFSVLTRFLHDLLDSCGNLLVVLGGVKEDLLRFRRENLIHAAAWDRLAQYSIDLLRLRKAEARAILEARLQAHFAPLGADSAMTETSGAEPLFPLGEAWYAERLDRVIDVQPRRVIDWARERWEQQQARLAGESADEWFATWERTDTVTEVLPRAEAVDALVAERLRSWADRRRQEPHTLPPSAANLAGLSATLLEQCLVQRADYGLDTLVRPRAKLPPYDFEVRRASGPGVGVLCVGTENATTAMASLRRLLHATDADGPGLLLVTDERRPLRLGQAGQRYYDDLTARAAPSFTHLELTFEEYIELDALQGVINEARSGDLEVAAGPGESPAVSAEEVIASHHRCGRYRGHRLLHEILGATTAPSDAAPALDLLWK